MEGRFVSYLRVSTEKQGASGLGLEAQRKAIEDYLNGGHWELIREFVEVESGKEGTSERPVLKDALEACKRTGSKLLIAKLDRLSRNVAFIANLLESKVEFVAVDFPSANKLTVHILAAMAEYEREAISKRTKEALKAARARGVRLGNPNGLPSHVIEKGRTVSAAVRKEKADQYARRIYDVIKEYMSQGISLNGIAKKLKEDRELTPRGKETWMATTVRNVLMRVERADESAKF
jgi:DNA invertase Pin-like site-specific DNA recombinase